MLNDRGRNGSTKHGRWPGKFPTITKRAAYRIGVKDDDLRCLLYGVERNLPGWAADADRGKHATGNIPNRGADAAHARLVLSLVDRVTPLPGNRKVAAQRWGICESGIREPCEAARDKALDGRFRQKRKNCLSDACARCQGRLDESSGCIGVRIRPPHDHRVAPVKNREMHYLGGRPSQDFDKGTGLPMEANDREPVSPATHPMTGYSVQG